jgi:phosphate transport system substrate-binding protein
VLLAIVFSPLFAAGDSGLQDYTPVSGVSGVLSSAGSDTLANLMTLWAEEFKRVYPNVRVQVQAAGSSTAPPALIEGTASLGPMSRAMKGRELEAFESRYGYPPTPVPVAIDAVAIYVHRDNPLPGLSLTQLDAIFSANRRCGAPDRIARWGELGLERSWWSRRIQMFGRNSVSGTYGFFKSVALCDGDFSSRVNEQPGSASVVQAISTALNGIGYSTLGYRTSSVRAVPLAVAEGAPFIHATPATASSGKYPLSRFMYVYVNKPPGLGLPPLEYEFIRLILSRGGQEIVLRDGYVPLSAEAAARALSLVTP